MVGLFLQVFRIVFEVEEVDEFRRLSMLISMPCVRVSRTKGFREAQIPNAQSERADRGLAPTCAAAGAEPAFVASIRNAEFKMLNPEARALGGHGFVFM
jgi:hypothetical protein